MRQLVQNSNTGEMELAEVPRPIPKAGEVLVRNVASAVSSGTERANLDFAKAGLIEKARRRPDLVKKVVNKAREEGALTAYREARVRLDTPFPVGYSSAGVLISAGAGAGEIAPGTLVACSGPEMATHAEYIALPETMIAPVPDGVDPGEAAFATLGAVALHGLRVGEAAVGERVAVIGLGILGLLAIQVARAAGLRVAGIDLSPERGALAAKLGAELVLEPGPDCADRVRAWCGETGGTDLTLVTAAAKSNEPVLLATEIARERGRLVLVGTVVADVPRRTGYDKELDVRFSRAWGPGMYDPDYQERGQDYPPSLVRWTASRNMEAFLGLLASGAVSLESLITHRFDISDGIEAYRQVEAGGEGTLGILITYPDERHLAPAIVARSSAATAAATARGEGAAGAAVEPALAHAAPTVARTGQARIGVIGAGLFATTALLPALAKTPDAKLAAIASATGLKAWHSARRYGFGYATSDPAELLADPAVDAVVIATRHDQHARLAVNALDAGKDVWVEKPLGMTADEVAQVADALDRSGRILVVGFNRRFSPLSVEAAEVLARSEGPTAIDIRVNPGPLEKGHWVLDEAEGGGRLLSEGCHFIDLAAMLAGGRVSSIEARPLGEDEPWRQGFTIDLGFESGSAARILYAGAGPRQFPREQIDAIGGGVAVSITSFRSILTASGGRRRRRRFLSVRRGHDELAATFVSAVARGTPIPGGTDSMLTSSMLTIAAAESMAAGAGLSVDATGRPAGP